MTDDQRDILRMALEQMEAKAGLVWGPEFLEEVAAALRALLDENAALKANDPLAEAWLTNATLRADLARANAELALLKAQADPLAEMWREFQAYQPQADRDGHGESWRRMCEERTEEAASAAYQARQASSHGSAAAYGAWWAAHGNAEVRRMSKDVVAWAADALVQIRRAKEGQP